MSTPENFDAWATFYDAIYGRGGADVDFYRDYYEDVEEPILELACGTGRAYLPLLEDGRDIYGLDMSESMLKRLEDKAEQSVHVRQEEMQNFSYPDTTFTSIFVTFNGLSHLPDLEDQTNCFKRVYDHLRNGGAFLFDVMIPDFDIVAHYGEIEVTGFRWNGDLYRIEKWTELVSKVEQTAVVHKKIIHESTRQIEFETAFRIGLIPKQQLELLLQHAGFRDIQFLAPFDRNQELREDHDRMLCIAQK